MDEEEKPIEQPEEKPKYDRSPGHIRMLHAKGNTYKEIAERLGTTENYIKKVIYEDNAKKKEAEKNKRPVGRPKGSKNKRTLAEEKMLANWQNSPMSPMMREDKADLNRAAGYFVTECWKMGQTIDHDDVDSMVNGLMQYVALCTQTGMPMLVKTCQLALGLTPTKVSAWRNKRSKANDPRYAEFVELMDSVIGAGMEASAAAGSIDKVLTIWWQKAHFNMIEGTGVQSEQTDPLGDKKSAAEIAKMYEEVELPD